VFAQVKVIQKLFKRFSPSSLKNTFGAQKIKSYSKCGQEQTNSSKCNKEMLNCKEIENEEVLFSSEAEVKLDEQQTTD